MLTPKQEHFVKCVADGMTQADAYRAAFNVKATTKAQTIHDSASKVMSNPEVSHRVTELKASLAKKALWTRENSVKALIKAYQEGNGSVKVQAVKELNLMHGFNAPMKHELTGANGEPIAFTKIERVIIDKP